jgi:hypothetical protein
MHAATTEARSGTARQGWTTVARIWHEQREAHLRVLTEFAALRITSSTRSGCDSIGTWLLATSTMVAAIRFATKRCSLNGAVFVGHDVPAGDARFWGEKRFLLQSLEPDATEVVLVGGLPVAQMPEFHRFDDATAGTGSGPEAGGGTDAAVSTGGARAGAGAAGSRATGATAAVSFGSEEAGTGSGPEAGGSRLLLRPLLIRPWRQLLIRTLHHLSRRPPRRTPLRRSVLLRRVSRCVERAPVARVYTFPPPIGGDHDRVNLPRLRGGSRYWHTSVTSAGWSEKLQYAPNFAGCAGDENAFHGDGAPGTSGDLPLPPRGQPLEIGKPRRAKIFGLTDCGR